MATPQKTNLSPLAERLRDSTAHTYSSENADFYRGFDHGRKSAAISVAFFAAEHLIEQTEPSAEDEDQAWGIMDHLPELKYGGDYVNHILAKILSDRTNAERRRIRELLVGKETK